MDEKEWLQGVGKRIRDVRKRTGQTQAELAERIGIGLSAMVAIELGRRPMKITTLTRISDALEMDVNDILGREPQSFVDERGYVYVTQKNYIGKTVD